MNTEDKDYLIYKYGKYNYAIGKTLAELLQSQKIEFNIKLCIKLLHFLYFISGGFDLPRFGVYTKTRLARIANRELEFEEASKLCSVIAAVYNILDKELIRNCICWNILNLKNFGTNKFIMVL